MHDKIMQNPRVLYSINVITLYTAHLFNPTVAITTNHGEAMVRLKDLLITKVITDKMVCELRADWDTFVRLADTRIDHEGVFAFFEQHQKELPMFARVS